MSGTGGAAAREMPVIHACIRNEITSVRGMVVQVDPHDTGRVTAVADHLDLMLELLHQHHETEDDLLWPQLKVRAALDKASIDRMEEQHHRIDLALVDIRTASAAWRTAPTAATAAALQESLDVAIPIIELHLDEEVRDVVPLIDRHFTAAEWEKVGKAGLAKFTPDQRWVALGVMTEVGTPESAAMTADMPLPVKVLWQLVGKRKYHGYIERVRG